jgi:predicted metal-dependent enzyme (double-stranded beta helix superfamily)
MEMAQIEIKNFLADLKSITATESDDREILKRVVPLAKGMAKNAVWLEDRFYKRDEKTGYGVTVLHAEENLYVIMVCWPPGQDVTPHDHQTWAVVAGIDGVEKNFHWLRKDDGSKAGYAEVDLHSEVNVGLGDTCVMLPNDIHSVLNDTDEPTLSLHVYGAILGDTKRFEFEPDKNLVRPHPQTERVC